MKALFRIVICAGAVMVTAPGLHAQVAGKQTVGVTVAEMSVVLRGWSARQDLLGKDVYNDKNEKLGDIDEILLDKSGKVNGIVIGVGGFLGMGSRDIMVEMDKLKFVDEPVRTSSATGGTGGTATTGSATRPATSTSSSASSTSNGKKWVPDHAVLSGATKDSVKSMPEFKFD